MEKGSEYRTHWRVDDGVGALPEVATTRQSVPTHLYSNRIRSTCVPAVEILQPLRSPQGVVLGFALTPTNWHRLSRSPEPFQEYDRAFQDCSSDIRSQIKWRLKRSPITVIGVSAADPKKMIPIAATKGRVPTQEHRISSVLQHLVSQVSGALDSRFGRVQAAVNEKDESVGVVGCGDGGSGSRLVCRDAVGCSVRRGVAPHPLDHGFEVIRVEWVIHVLEAVGIGEHGVPLPVDYKKVLSARDGCGGATSQDGSEQQDGSQHSPPPCARAAQFLRFLGLG